MFKKNVFLHAIFIFLVCFLGVLGANFLFSKVEAISNIDSQIQNLFSDYTCTKLKDENTTLEDIENLKSQYEDTQTLNYLNRAEDVIKGKVRYTSLNEFSNQNNTIYQAGDFLSKFSKYKLRYNTTDLIPTGIYGKTNSVIKVFVKCDSNNLPSLILTQQHGYYSGGYRRSFPLQKGLNLITFPDFVSSSSYIPKSEVKGGAVYLINPYTFEEQGNVNVYIEGDGYYPIFDKTKSEKEFLGRLKEYEENRLKNKDEFLDLAELKGEHFLTTTTSSSLYSAYIENSVSPTQNLNLWGDFITKILEFNGFATSEASTNPNYDKTIDYLVINFRYMSAVADSGAYTSDRHIGFYKEFDWFANFKTKSLQYLNFYNICHEIGHQLDVLNRKIDETTNNMTATYAYLYLLDLPANANQQPFLRTLEKLYSDYTLDKNAFREGHILYGENDLRDRNYMIWWYLESVFPNFWANLNNAYRENKATDLYNANEKMVYYSSKIVGLDLTDYFDRFGLFMDEGYINKFNKQNTSSTFKNYMSEIEKGYDHFYLVDLEEYNFIRVNFNLDHTYLNATPVIESVQKVDSGHNLTISNNRSKSHLGYEIFSSTDNENFTLCGFTYSNSFLDKQVYTSPVYYKAQAVNRFFNVTSLSASQTVGEESEILPVCKVEDENFSTLDAGIKSVLKGGSHEGKTVYLLNDCYINDCTFYQALNIEVAENVTRNITIFGGEKFMFRTNYIFNMTGRENARIIIDGGLLNRSDSAFYLGAGDCTLKYVTFKDCEANTLGGAIYQSMCNLTLLNCEFINCSSRTYNCSIYFSNTTKDDTFVMENCNFKNEDLDIYFKYPALLSLNKTLPNMKIFIENVEGPVEFSCDFSVKEEDLQNLQLSNDLDLFIEGNKIILQKTNFLLTFVLNDDTFEYTSKHKNFVFGEEILQNFDEKKYIFKYIDSESLEEFEIGDTITLTKNKTFNTQVKDKFKVNLHLKNTIKTLYLKPNEEVFLSNFDDTNKIVSFSNLENVYYTNTLFSSTKDVDLYADYINLLKIQFIVNEKISYNLYKAYNEEISCPDCEVPDFKGWLKDGEILGSNDRFSAKKDEKIYALFSSLDIINLDNAQIEILPCDLTYSGEEIKPNIKVTILGNVILQNLYNVEYSNNINCGVATIKITKNAENVYGEKSISFTILPRQLTESDVNLSYLNTFTYDGNEKNINLSITFNNKNLILNSDYNVVYSGNKTNAGEVNFTITFIKNYSGKIIKSFTILKKDYPDYTNTIYLDFEATTLKDITPPENFEWVDEDYEVPSTTFEAAAKYTGEDFQNYEHLEVLITIVIKEKEDEKEEEPLDSTLPKVVSILIITLPILFVGVMFIICVPKRKSK